MLTHEWSNSIEKSLFSYEFLQNRFYFLFDRKFRFPENTDNSNQPEELEEIYAGTMEFDQKPSSDYQKLYSPSNTTPRVPSWTKQSLRNISETFFIFEVPIFEFQIWDSKNIISGTLRDAKQKTFYNHTKIEFWTKI